MKRNTRETIWLVVSIIVVLVIATVVGLFSGESRQSPESAYSSLAAYSKDLTLLNGVQNLLNWDEKTIMPPGGGQSRANTNAVMAEVLATKSADPRIGAWLEAANRKTDWPLIQKANLREWERDYKLSTNAPPDFYKKQAELTGAAYLKWEEARQKNDFSVLAPALQKLVDMDKQEARYYGFEKNPYDGLLNKFEEGLTTAGCEEIYSSLKAELPGMIKGITAAQGTKPVVFTGDYPIETQQAFNKMITQNARFDMQEGRIDTTIHPFCLGIDKGDVRITTAYDTSDPTFSFGHQIHETGHGLYEQGLKADGTPAGMPCSWGVHEANSRFHENMVGKNAAFWSHWYPTFASMFGISASLGDFLKYYNWVQPGPIRTEADEVSYQLHLLVRFEIERDLFNGNLKVKDIPAVWKQKYHDYLGVEVTDDLSGPLQDVHWSNNLFGYFPSYTMGDIYSAQIFDAMKSDVPGLEASWAAGDFTSKHRWLSEHIYPWGRVYNSDQLIEKATGKPVSTSF